MWWGDKIASLIANTLENTGDGDSPVDVQEEPCKASCGLSKEDTLDPLGKVPASKNRREKQIWKDAIFVRWISLWAWLRFTNVPGCVFFTFFFLDATQGKKEAEILRSQWIELSRNPITTQAEARIMFIEPFHYSLFNEHTCCVCDCPVSCILSVFMSMYRTIVA